MYVCDVMVYSIQVYSKLYSLQQIVVSYKLQVYIMLSIINSMVSSAIMPIVSAINPKLHEKTCY